jgi:hypothetical protein
MCWAVSQALVPPSTYARSRSSVHDTATHMWTIRPGKATGPRIAQAHGFSAWATREEPSSSVMCSISSVLVVSFFLIVDYTMSG